MCAAARNDSRGRASYPSVPVVPRYRVVLFRFGWPTIVRQPAADYDGGHADQQGEYYVQLGFAWNTIFPVINMKVYEGREYQFFIASYFPAMS